MFWKPISVRGRNKEKKSIRSFFKSPDRGLIIINSMRVFSTCKCLNFKRYLLCQTALQNKIQFKTIYFVQNNRGQTSLTKNKVY